MPVHVQVHAAIPVDGKIVVYRHRRRGTEIVTLPGGRIKQRESVTAALVREAQEEIDRPIEVGVLLLAAEVLDATRETVVLVFAASLGTDVNAEGLELIDPGSPAAAAVLPPVLGQLAQFRCGLEPEGARWMGNLYTPFRAR